MQNNACMSLIVTSKNLNLFDDRKNSFLKEKTGILS